MQTIYLVEKKRKIGRLHGTGSSRFAYEIHDFEKDQWDPRESLHARVSMTKCKQIRERATRTSRAPFVGGIDLFD